MKIVCDTGTGVITCAGILAEPGITVKKLCFFIALYILNYKKVKNGIDNELCKEYNMQHRVHVYANKKCIVKNKKYISKE